MTEDRYGNLPAFSHGQVVSAAAHLNTLQRYTSNLHDDLLGFSVPAWGYTTAWMIRHRWNTLRYELYASDSGTLNINGVIIASWSGSGWKSGTVSTSGLTTNAFYEITPTNVINCRLLAEIPDTSPPALISFVDGVTPSAAAWQALSDYAAWLGYGLSAAAPLATRYGSNVETERTISGSLIHRARYLTFHVAMQNPYDEVPNSDKKVCELKMNDGFFWLRVGDSGMGGGPPSGGTLLYREKVVGGGTYVNWTCQVDTETYPGALAYGDRYSFDMEWKIEYSPNISAGAYDIYRIYESPYGDMGCSDEGLSPSTEWSTISGYTMPEAWSHGDYVRGTPGAFPSAGRIAANLVALGACDAFYNFAAPARMKEFLYGVRRRRWLLYQTFADESCTVHYDYQGETQIVTLPEASSYFLAADLDSLEGLVPGTHYWLGGTKYAMEDVHA